MGDTGVSFRSMNSTQIIDSGCCDASCAHRFGSNRPSTANARLFTSLHALIVAGSIHIWVYPRASLASFSSYMLAPSPSPPHSMLLHCLPGSTLGHNPPPQLWQAHTIWIRRFLLRARETSYPCPSSNHHAPPSALPEADNTGSTSPRTVYGGDNKDRSATTYDDTL